MDFCFDDISQVSGAGRYLLPGREIFLRSSILLLEHICTIFGRCAEWLFYTVNLRVDFALMLSFFDLCGTSVV